MLFCNNRWLLDSLLWGSIVGYTSDSLASCRILSAPYVRCFWIGQPATSILLYDGLSQTVEMLSWQKATVSTDFLSHLYITYWAFTRCDRRPHRSVRTRSGRRCINIISFIFTARCSTERGCSTVNCPSVCLSVCDIGVPDYLLLIFDLF